MNGASVGQQTSTSSTTPLDFAVPGTLADGQYLFTATAGTVSGLVSPFSTPFTVTVDNTPPAISSFGLDPGFVGAGRTATNTTRDADDRLQGQTVPGATVTLVETGAETTADSSGNFAFYPVNFPDLGATHVHRDGDRCRGQHHHPAPRPSRGSTTRSPSNLLPPDVTLNLSETTARVGDTVTFIDPDPDPRRPAPGQRGLAHQRQSDPDQLDWHGDIHLGDTGRVHGDGEGVRRRGQRGRRDPDADFLTPPNGLPAPVAGFNETVVTPVVTMPTPIMGTANTPDLPPVHAAILGRGPGPVDDVRHRHDAGGQRHAGHDRPDDDAQRVLRRPADGRGHERPGDDGRRGLPGRRPGEDRRTSR